MAGTTKLTNVNVTGEFQNSVVDTRLVKTYQFEVGTFKKGNIAPTEVLVGSSPEVRGLLFDATNEKASFTFMTPLDAASNADFQMMFMCAIAAGKTESAGDLINLKVDYRVNFPANATPTKLDSTGASVTTQTTSTTAPFNTLGNDNVIIDGANTEFYTYMPHIFLPSAAMVPGGVFWGEVSLNDISSGNVDSIIIYQMHVNYFEKSLSDQVG